MKVRVNGRGRHTIGLSAYVDGAGVQIAEMSNRDTTGKPVNVPIPGNVFLAFPADMEDAFIQELITTTIIGPS